MIDPITIVKYTCCQEDNTGTLMHGFLADISIAIVAASIAGIIFHILKQPVIIGFIVSGIVIGNNIGPQLVTDPANIEMISETGIVLLLFFVGLEMNPGKVVHSGKIILFPALGQFPLSFGIGVLFFLIIGMATDVLQGAYLSASCALSSTAIVMKTLYECRESDSLHGRVSAGVLVMQDIWALIILAVLPEIGSGGAFKALLVVSKTVALFAAALFISKYILRKLFSVLTPHPEMTVTASIGWCTGLAALSGYMGLSPALGALSAGFSISVFPYSIFVKDKMEPLRDFFLMLFFVSIGLKIIWPNMALAGDVLIIIAFVIVSRLIAVYPFIRIAGGSSRTAFISSLGLSQVSEFSLIIMGAGIASGQLTSHQMSVLLYVMAIMAVLSSYALRKSHSVYSMIERIFRLTKSDKTADADQKKYPIVVLGYHRGTQYFIEMLAKKSPDLLESVVVIDYNKEAMNKLSQSGVAGHLGDMSRLEVLERAGVKEAKIIIATIPTMLIKGTRIELLVKMCRQLAPDASIIASADFRSQIEEMKIAGADKIILPYLNAGDQCAAEVISILKNQ
jgi:Kef-type K+ transport system membrane component KefB